jgi:hypothetical protein
MIAISRKPAKSPRFVMLPHMLPDSPEFAIASSGATRLLILLLRRYNGRNNGTIACSVRDAAKWLHCSKSTASACFAELEQLGLIRAVCRGSFTIKLGELKGVATTWSLTFVDRSNGGLNA